MSAFMHFLSRRALLGVMWITPCMQSSTYIVIVIIYVDDLIILASDMTKLMEFKAKLEN